MPILNRVRATWTNFPGAPGLSPFYLAAGSTNVAPIVTFFTAIKDLFPNGLSITVPSTGDAIDTADNKIVGGWTGSGGGTATSTTTTAPYSGTSGALVHWSTNAVLNGRRLAGRTYLVPLGQTQYANDGSLATTAVTSITNAANALIAALTPSLIVYGPPRDAGTLGPTDPGKASISSPAIAATVPDLAVVMRSRRI
ncbi:MAG: hypothetical protein [Circular genetic element sp.]|nr:MAG: hypothetical protein [Circular genetic element sp.]